MKILTVCANGISLAVEDNGAKTAIPLILIRGLGTQMAHWPRELVEGFVDNGFRTVAFDNRDVGLSQRCPANGVPATADEILACLRNGDALPAAYGLDDMARDVIGLMDALDIDRAHLFGISMGGMIAQQLLIKAEERVLSATIVMSSCRPSSERWATGGTAQVDVIARLLSRPQKRDEYVAAQIEEHRVWGSPGYPMTPDEIRAVAELAYARGADPDGQNRHVLAAVNAPDLRSKLAITTTRCLVIHGEDDTLIPLEMGREVATTIPRSDFLPVPGMGHIITPKLAPLIVDAVSDFVHAKAGDDG